MLSLKSEQPMIILKPKSNEKRVKTVSDKE